MRFAERLKYLRKELNLKQDDLAKSCGVKLTAISKYETGLIKPAFEMLAKIGLAYNINLNWLVNEMGSMFIETPNRRLIKTGTDDFSVEETNNTITIMEKTHSMELNNDLKVEYYGSENENFTKIYHKNGDVEYQAKGAIPDNFEAITNKIAKICNNENKFEFIMTALDALDNEKALQELKILIKGIELVKNK